MKIGIDIDDTTVITVNSMIKYAEKYHTQILGRKPTKGEYGFIPNQYYLNSLYGWTQKEKNDFFHLFYQQVLEECTIMPNADKVCQKLKQQGNELYFITARLTNITNCHTEEITRKTLTKNNIPYDKLILNAKNKLEVCQQEKIEMLIEDSYETCLELFEKGIKTILMTTKMNEKIETNDITRVKGWNEIDKLIEGKYKKEYFC